jgi:ABC-2 type transport system permease protein
MSVDDPASIHTEGDPALDPAADPAFTPGGAAPPDDDSARAPGVIRRVLRQTSYDLLIFRRNPASTFFTVILPVIFLVVFTTLFGNETLANGAKVATLYVPGILSLSIIAATAVNLAINMTSRRERGVLKRLRGTPMPPWVFIASQAIAGLVISMFMTALIVFIGRVIYRVELNVEGIPSLLISLVIGAVSFGAIGLALTVIIPSEDASPAVTNAIFLPLYFISDVFIPAEQAPDWISRVAEVFPVLHLSKALQVSFDPFAEGPVWPWGHWLVLAAWGAFGLAVALTRFRWTPRR